MSSTRKNTHTTRPYRERPTPHSREKLGLLQKHKDYSLRARSFNEKKAKLRLLRQKANDRNEDEFSFGMLKHIRARESEGTGDLGKLLKPDAFKRERVVEGQGKTLSHDTVKLLKTQDSAYLRGRLAHVRRAREKLEQAILVEEKDPRRVESEGQGLLVLGAKEGSKRRGMHTVFVEDEEQQQSFDAEEWFDTDEVGVQKSWNRPRRPQKEAYVEIDANSDLQKRRVPTARQLQLEKEAEKKRKDDSRRKQAGQKSLMRKLEILQVQEKELQEAERELALQRDRMQNNVGGVNKAGVTFKVRERKR